MPYLILDSWDDQHRKFKLGKGSYAIGRKKKLEITIKDPTISRKHTRVLYDEGSYYVQDVESKNGTFLNGDLIRGREKLKNGDKVRIGKNVLTFLEEEQEKRVEENPPAALSGEKMEELGLMPPVPPRPVEELPPRVEPEKSPRLLVSRRKVVRGMPAGVVVLIWVLSVGFGVAVVFGSKFLFSRMMEWMTR